MYITLSSQKCSNIHIANSNEIEHHLKIHDSDMKSSKVEKCLGNVINKNGTVKPKY